MSKVIIKLYGPCTPGDPLAGAYRDNPVPTFLEVELNELTGDVTLPYDTILIGTTEGTDYLQWLRKDGLGSAKINQLKTFLNNNKNNATYGTTATELLALIDVTELKDIITYCNNILKGPSTDAQKLRALEILKIVLLIKIIL